MSLNIWTELQIIPDVNVEGGRKGFVIYMQLHEKIFYYAHDVTSLDWNDAGLVKDMIDAAFNELFARIYPEAQATEIKLKDELKYLDARRAALISIIEELETVKNAVV